MRCISIYFSADGTDQEYCFQNLWTDEIFILHDNEILVDFTSDEIVQASGFLVAYRSSKFNFRKAFSYQLIHVNLRVRLSSCTCYTLFLLILTDYIFT